MSGDQSKEHLPGNEPEREGGSRPLTPEEMLQSILNPETAASSSEALAPPEDSPALSPQPQNPSLARPEDLQFALQSEAELEADAPLTAEEESSRAETPTSDESATLGGLLSDTAAEDAVQRRRGRLESEAAKRRPQLDPHLREAAERLTAMRNQAAALTDLLNNQEITFDEYQDRLYDAMVQDEAGMWWVIDAENEQWYCHNPDSNQWEEDDPAALHELERYNRAAAAYERESFRPQAGDPIVDSRGVKIGTVQPATDEHYTIPGAAAFSDELSDQKATVRAVGADATRRSAASGFDRLADDSGLPAYELEASPIVQEVLDARRGNARRRLVSAVAAVLIPGLIAIIAAAVGIMVWYGDAVRPFQEGIAGLAGYSPEFQTARILDANGALIAALNSQQTGARTSIPLDDMSPYIIHAIISQENERYFADPGFDPIAIVRAFIQNISGGGIESGASTITQQIARNLVLRDTEVSIERKVNEILVALEIANQYDKNFILELYLNEVFFANQNYGVEAASQFYFGHGADELNFAEAALLASIVPSPSQNDPVVNRPTAIQGMRATMHKMMDIGCLQFQHGDWPGRGPFCIRAGQEVMNEGIPQILVRTNSAGEIAGGLAIVQIAEIEATEFEPLDVRLRYPHFVNYVQAQVEAEFGVNALFQRGFHIYTTLNPVVQEAAETALSNRVSQLVSNGVNTGAVMVTDPKSGAIRAMVGSHDFDDDVAGQVNNVLTFQQPGSAIKPIVYTAAISGHQGNYLTPASILWDVPVTYDLGAGSTYSPVNFDRQFHGPVSLRVALQNSYNVAAVKTYLFSGSERFVEMAQTFGLQFPDGTVPTIASALGANEVRLFDMMQAYGVFASGGRRVPLYAIERITETIDGEEVEVGQEVPGTEQAISPAVAYLMQNILSDDHARRPTYPPGSPLTLENIGIPTQNFVAAKTGTSNDSRDLWTMGFTGDAVVGVWLGTYNNSPTFGTTGYNSAAPVWNAVMQAAMAGQAPSRFENPGGVVVREICRSTGTINHPDCPEPTTGLFIQEQFPPGPEQGFIQTVAIDSWTGLLANDFCDDHVIEETFAALDDLSAVDWLNTTAEGQEYAEVMGLSFPVSAAPPGSCVQGQGLPVVHISSPNDGAVIRGAVEIRGQVRAPDFSHYELLYARAGQDESFFPISAALVQVPEHGGFLGVWDTLSAQIPTGEYILRLLATSLTGGFIQHDLNILVDNPKPDATATPVFSPTVVSVLTPSGG